MSGRRIRLIASSASTFLISTASLGSERPLEVGDFLIVSVACPDKTGGKLIRSTVNYLRSEERLIVEFHEGKAVKIHVLHSQRGGSSRSHTDLVLKQILDKDEREYADHWVSKAESLLHRTCPGTHASRTDLAEEMASNRARIGRERDRRGLERD